MQKFDRFLPESPIIENADFVLYTDVEIDFIKEKLLNYLSSEKIKLLNFLGLESFEKVSINLFYNHELYLKFTKQFFEPASYSKGNFVNGMINYVYNTNYEQLKKSLIHEYVHLLYQRKCLDRVIWFDEGLALYLSGQYDSLEHDNDNFRHWYFDKIINKSKEIPDISFLKQHGSKYGQFIDMETNKYNGYDLSYLMVRYLIDNYQNIKDLLINKEKILVLEENILKDCITYYNNYFTTWNNTSIKNDTTNKIVYHGSPNGDIEYLVARKSTHQKECIYATNNKTVALLFMGKGNGDLDTKISTVNGRLELVERRKNVLNDLYNHDGYLYELDGATFTHYDYLWSLEVISFEKRIKPFKKNYCKNILAAILEEEEKGNIKVYKYPDRPSNVPLDNSDLIDKFIDFENKGLHGALDHMLSIYPEFKEEVLKKINKDSSAVNVKTIK